MRLIEFAAVLAAFEYLCVLDGRQSVVFAAVLSFVKRESGTNIKLVGGL